MKFTTTIKNIFIAFLNTQCLLMLPMVLILIGIIVVISGLQIHFFFLHDVGVSKNFINYLLMVLSTLLLSTMLVTIIALKVSEKF